MNNQTQQKPPTTPTLPTGQPTQNIGVTPPSTGGSQYIPPAEGGPITDLNWGGPSVSPPSPGGQGAGNNNAANFGQPLYPWLMPYGGQFTAPMSPTEQNALNQYSGFVEGGQGLDPAYGYLGNVLNNQYLDLNRNPFLQQIQTAMQGMKDYNDQQAISRLQSNAAAGGSALSGALLGGESDYMRNSNNTFQTLMGNLMNENYARERGLQSMAPGQLQGLAGQVGQGYGQMFGMGALPRNLQQNDFNAQYQDWLRQTGGMRDMFQYPDTLTQQLLYGGGFRGQTPNQYGNSTMDMLAGLLGNSGIDWQGAGSGILNWLGGLFGGGDTGGNTAEVQPQADGVRYDGAPLGYDATSTGPMGYGDANYYNNALTQAQNAFATQQANAAKGPNNTVPAILALLLQLLGGGKKKQSSNAAKPGGGAQPGAAPKPGTGPGTGSQPSRGSDQYGLDPYTGLPPGASFNEGTGTGNIDWANYGYRDPYTGQIADMSNPNQDLSEFLSQTPPNWTSPDAMTSPYDIFPDQGNNPPGGSPDPFSGGNDFSNIGSNPGDFGGIDTGGFDPGFGGNMDFGDFGAAPEDF